MNVKMAKQVWAPVLLAFLFSLYGKCLAQRFNHSVDLPTTRPLIIAHRGSSGVLPEHTIEAYRLAVEQGADIIECDVCITKDLQLICSHESWLSPTTDVLTRFPDRIRTRFVDDVLSNITDVFSVDLTLAEVKQLRTRQRMSYRDDRYDDRFPPTTLQEYINVAKSSGRPIGIYPETKHPDWVNNLDIVKNANTTFEDLLVEELHKNGYTKRTDPCFIQSFSEESIRSLATKTELPLVMLMIPVVDDDSDERLEELSQFCYGIGPAKDLIQPVWIDNGLLNSTDLVNRAHKFGLKVHPYTFRNENRHLAFDYMQDPNDEYERFFSLQVDGYFTDFTHTLNRFLNEKYRAPCNTVRGGATKLKTALLPVLWLSYISVISFKFL